MKLNSLGFRLNFDLETNATLFVDDPDLDQYRRQCSCAVLFACDAHFENISNRLVKLFMLNKSQWIRLSVPFYSAVVFDIRDGASRWIKLVKFLLPVKWSVKRANTRYSTSLAFPGPLRLAESARRERNGKGSRRGEKNVQNWQETQRSCSLFFMNNPS